MQQDDAIAAALLVTKSVKVSRYGGDFENVTIHLTPDLIFRAGGLELFLAPRREIRIDLSELPVNLLMSDIDVGRIYSCTDLFPSLCCICMKPVTNWQIIQLLSSQKYYSSAPLKLNINPNIIHALFHDRFWITMPFCSKHGLKDGGLSISIRGISNNECIKFSFTNRDYALMFAQMHDKPVKEIWGVTSSSLPNLLRKFGFKNKSKTVLSPELDHSDRVLTVPVIPPTPPKSKIALLSATFREVDLELKARKHKMIGRILIILGVLMCFYFINIFLKASPAEKLDIKSWGLRNLIIIIFPLFLGGWYLLRRAKRALSHIEKK